MSDYPMLISNKLHSFRNFNLANLSILTLKSKIKLYILVIYRDIIKKGPAGIPVSPFPEVFIVKSTIS